MPFLLQHNSNKPNLLRNSQIQSRNAGMNYILGLFFKSLHTLQKNLYLQIHLLNLSKKSFEKSITTITVEYLKFNEVALVNSRCYSAALCVNSVRMEQKEKGSCNPTRGLGIESPSSCCFFVMIFNWKLQIAYHQVIAYCHIICRS